MIVGRIVDSYTNILTLKLFARLEREDAYVREAIDAHTATFRHQLRTLSTFTMLLQTLNAVLFTTESALAILLWDRGAVDVGVIAMTIPLTWQIVSAAGFVAQQVTDIFDNIGAVQEGMLTIARPITLTDDAWRARRFASRAARSVSRTSPSAMDARPG